LKSLAETNALLQQEIREAREEAQQREELHQQELKEVQEKARQREESLLTLLTNLRDESKREEEQREERYLTELASLRTEAHRREAELAARLEAVQRALSRPPWWKRLWPWGKGRPSEEEASALPGGPSEPSEKAPSEPPLEGPAEPPPHPDQEEDTSSGPSAEEIPPSM
jgi:hypothetical protein